MTSSHCSTQPGNRSSINTTGTPSSHNARTVLAALKATSRHRARRRHRAGLDRRLRPVPRNAVRPGRKTVSSRTKNCAGLKRIRLNSTLPGAAWHKAGTVPPLPAHQSLSPARLTQPRWGVRCCKTHPPCRPAETPARDQFSRRCEQHTATMESAQWRKCTGSTRS